MKKIVALVLSLVMVMGLATVAFGVDAEMKVWEDSTKTWDTYYISAGSDLEDLEVGAKQNCLPAYKLGTEYFVETTEAAATYKLVYGNKTVFVAKVDATDVEYIDNGVVFTNVSKKATDCGKLVITDSTATYYATYDEVGETYTYYYGVKNGSKQILVDGKIVDVELNPVQALTGHAWAGNDVVDHAYVNVKCANCGKVAALFATATAAGKDSVKTAFGYITFADATTFGASAPAADATVESAKTFDAGIAMYVGMSVMAAAGSAVVLKKKD